MCDTDVDDCIVAFGVNSIVVALAKGTVCDTDVDDCIVAVGVNSVVVARVIESNTVSDTDVDDGIDTDPGSGSMCTSTGGVDSSVLE